MTVLSPQFEEIKELTCSIVKHLEQDEFELVNELLDKRLVLLKALDKSLNTTKLDEALTHAYQQFLLDIQQQDNIQLEVLLAEKSKLMAQSLQQKKTKTAISAYTSVKHG